MADVLNLQPAVHWFEIISDNFMPLGAEPLGGLDRKQLFAIREHYPVSMHGVGLSLGSVDPLDWDYLRTLKSLANSLECQWISEHAAFVSIDSKHYHDLLPLPYTEEALDHLSQRILQVQDYLGHPILIENATNYFHCKYDTLTDGEFMAELVRRSGCHLLVDINNLYVNQHNHGWEASRFIDTVPRGAVKEIHLAGYSERGNLLIDTHNAEVAEPVWALYRNALKRFGPVPSLIEWDNQLPGFELLQQEAAKADRILSEIHIRRAEQVATTEKDFAYE